MGDTINKNPARFIEKWLSLGYVQEEYAKSRGLTLMSFMVLRIIYMNSDCCTQKLICEQSRYTKQCVNAIVKTFWKQGYVVLKEEETDRRNKKIIFTEKGQKYADEIVGAFSAAEKEAAEHLSREQWEQLVEMAGVFADQLSAELIRLIRATDGE